MAGGIHGQEVAGPDGRMDPAKVAGLLGDAGLNAAYAMTTLAW